MKIVAATFKEILFLISLYKIFLRNIMPLMTFSYEGTNENRYCEFECGEMISQHFDIISSLLYVIFCLLYVIDEQDLLFNIGRHFRRNAFK